MVRQHRRIPKGVFALMFILPYIIAACGGNVTIGGITFGKQRVPPTIVTVANTNPAPRALPSQNWAGYGARRLHDVTSITATWQVPQVTGAADSDSSTWIGIGGINSNSLIQAGTDQLIQGNKPYYYVWTEILPASPKRVSEIDLLPGDTITVTITQQQANKWSIILNDHDASQSVTKPITYVSCLCSAEWIEEAPSINGQETQLASFTSATFAQCSVSVAGKQLSLSQVHAQAIAMISPQGATMVEPQVLDSAGFSVVDLMSTST